MSDTENQVNDASFFEDGDDGAVINMAEIKEASFELVPKGTYAAVIESVEFGTSKAGNPKWAAVYCIVGGDFDGRKIFDNISFSQKALPYTKATIKNFAPDLLTASFNPKAIAESGELVGKQITIKIKHEQYEGNTNARVASISAPLKGAGDEFFG